jgi:acetyltransferase-like isoleucine patch superfamily enzyme
MSPASGKSLSDSSSSESAPLLSEQQERVSREGGLKLYREIIVGRDGGWGSLFLHELLCGAGNLLPGILGIGFRTVFYPSLFRESGRRPYVGKSVTLRNPAAITLGNKVWIDDDVTLDCRVDAAIEIGSHVAIGRGSIVTAKGGNLVLHDGANIGSMCRIATQTGIEIGESALIAAYCYIGPGNHQWDEATNSYITGSMES